MDRINHESDESIHSNLFNRSEKRCIRCGKIFREAAYDRCSECRERKK